MEEKEILRAAVAVAVADGKLTRSEMGVLQSLAARAGVGQASFQAMIEAAEQGEDIAHNLLIQRPEAARRAIELLVAQSRIDGEIAPEEREILVRIACDIGLTGESFQEAYERGIRRADRLRKSRRRTE